MIDNKPFLLGIMPFLSPLTPALSRKGRGSAYLELRKQPYRSVVLIRLSQRH